MSKKKVKHVRITSTNALCVISAVALIVCVAVMPAEAQNGRPAPQEPVSRVPASNGNDANTPDGAQNSPATGHDDAAATERDDRDQNASDDATPPTRPSISTRRVLDDDGEGVIIALNDAALDDKIFAFIVEVSGKVVMPVNLPSLRNKRITLVHDEPVTREQALDLLFTTLRLNGIGVIERDDVIIIDDIINTARIGDLPVLSPADDVLRRTDRGTVVIKIFSVVNANAEGIGDQVQETIPDYAKLTVDANSNQIVLLGDIAVAQQVQKLITELDNNYIDIVTQTFRLAHADALEVEENIWDLFEDGGAVPTVGQSARRPTAARGAQQRTPGRATAQASGTPATGGPVVQPRLTVNIPQNTVTVQAERSVVQMINELIVHQWDLPRPTGTSKVYRLKHTDPVTVRDILRQVLGQDAQMPGRTGGRAGAAGAGGRSDVASIVSGIYQIEAFADTNSLLVLAKTAETFEFLDHLVNQLDQPSTAGLPIVIELKHANAVNLSEELNALLAHGGNPSIPRPQTGLTGQSIRDSGTGAGALGGGGGQPQQGGSAGQISFPWQERTPEFGKSPESPLIGQARIVPIVRQNALAILAPMAKQEAIRELIETFDRPGRQVMISAVIAEVTLSDALALGLRLSSSEDIGGRFPDYGFGATSSVLGNVDDVLGSLFTSSVLDVNFNVNAWFQALSRTNAVRVLQNPRIFTSDNQEAQFFDGQTVPFISDVLVTDVGGVRESFEREDVGVRLNVRPRITVNGDVDMEIVLELSSVVPGTSGASIVIDRRETATQVIVRDGQTIVLSGILREQESEIRRKVPILGDIPLLNLLFSSTDREVTQSELIAFITPIIVDNPSANDENFNVQERERLHDLSRPLQERGKEVEQLRERIISDVQIEPDIE